MCGRRIEPFHTMCCVFFGAVIRYNTIFDLRTKRGCAMHGYGVVISSCSIALLVFFFAVFPFLFFHGKQFGTNCTHPQPRGSCGFGCQWKMTLSSWSGGMEKGHGCRDGPKKRQVEQVHFQRQVRETS